MSEPRRLHPAAIVVLALRVARELVFPVLIPIVFPLVSRGLDGVSARWVLLAGTGFALFLLASLSWGVLRWRRFTYAVVGGELQVHSGVINRKRRSVPLERIQAFDSSQGIVQRLLGLYSVGVQTAGGGAGRPEVSLPGLTRSASEELRAAISARPSAAAANDVSDASAAPSTDTVRSLSIADLLLAGTTSGRIGVALSLLISALAIFDDVFLIEAIIDAQRRLAWLLLIVGPIGVALALWLIGVFGMVLAHAGFTLTRRGDFLTIERGLLERRRATIALDRVQAIRVIEGLLRQPFGLAELRVESAAYGTRSGESTVLFPLVRQREILPLLREMLPDFALDVSVAPLPARARRRYLLQLDLLVPGLLLAGGLAWLDYPRTLPALLIVPGLIAFGLLQYRDSGWRRVDDVLVLRTRQVARATTLIPRRRMQQAELRQSWFQRRAGLATAVARVASGSGGAELALRHVDADEAQAFLGWVSPPRVSAAQAAGD